MADSPEEVVVTETLKTLQNGATEIPEEAQEMTEEGDPNGNDAEPVFSAGHLSFIGHEAYVIPLSLIREFGSRTKRLDLSFNCLRSLEGIDGFTELEELLLDNNEIDDEVEFPCLPKLNTLTLNKNKIGDLDRLIQMIQVQLPSLVYLSLLGNVACPNQLSSYDKDEEDYQRYRLKFLDSTPVRSLEVAEARRVGPFMKVVRPGSSGKSVIKETASTELPYSPLPSSKRQDGQHIGTYGACKYVYYGRHSEGNRFIRNADL